MIYFFYGEDTFSIAAELRGLKESFLQKNKEGAIEEIAISADAHDDETRGRLRELFENPGFFAKEKLVIVKDLLTFAKDLPKTLELFLKNAGKPVSWLTVVVVQAASFDRRIKAYKALQKTAKAKEFLLPRFSQLEAWIRQQLEDEGYEIEPPAQAELVRRLGEDFSLWQVRGELEKLMLLAFPRKKISLSQVRESAPVNINYDVFSLTNAVAEGRGAEALHILRELLEQGGAQEKSLVIQIIGAFASQIHSLLLVKNVDGSAQDMAKILGWKEGRVWINLKLAKKFTAERLKKMLWDLKQIDLRAKTSDEPVKLLLSLFVHKAKVS